MIHSSGIWNLCHISWQILPIVVQTFHSGLKCWTNGLTNQPSALLLWLKIATMNNVKLANFSGLQDQNKTLQFLCYKVCSVWHCQHIILFPRYTENHGSSFTYHRVWKLNSVLLFYQGKVAGLCLWDLKRLRRSFQVSEIITVLSFFLYLCFRILVSQRPALWKEKVLSHTQRISNL